MAAAGRSPGKAAYAAAAAGPALAVVLLAGFALGGEAAVQALYEGRAPLAVLNRVITGQRVHPVSYHLERAAGLIRGLALVAAVAGGLWGGWVAWARRHSRVWLADRRWGVLLVGTAGFWLLFAWRVPVFEALPGWFWPLRPKRPPGAWLVLPLTVVGGLAAAAAVRAQVRARLALALLIAGGYLAHHGLALTEGRGALAARMTGTGHAVFARTAVAGPDTWSVMTRYDRLLADGELPGYFHSTKPPGLQAWMNLTAAASRWLWPGADRMAAVARLAAIVFPLLGVLTLVPLYGLAGLLLPRRDALVAAVLLPLVPSLALIQLHADQYMNPLLGTSFAYLCCRGLERREPFIAAAAGAVLVLGLWFSFAVGALAPLALLAAWGAARRHGWHAALSGLAALAAGAVLAYGAGRLALGYDALARGRQAMAAHRLAKGAAGGPGDRVYFAGLDLLEFAVWCGPPFVLLVGAELWRVVRRQAWRAPTPLDALSLSLGAILAMLALGSGTAGETARLWLFLTPLAAVSAARTLGRLAPGHRRAAVGLVAALQWGTVLALKFFQDFV